MTDALKQWKDLDKGSKQDLGNFETMDAAYGNFKKTLAVIDSIVKGMTIEQKYIFLERISMRAKGHKINKKGKYVKIRIKK